jgi:molybdopterin-biosynthesis enzyme MoeA-like protein
VGDIIGLEILQGARGDTHAAWLERDFDPMAAHLAPPLA